MRHIIRRCWPVLLAMTGVLALVGCDAGPSRVGAAAVVGDTRISVDSVQQEFRWLLNNIPQARELEQQKKLGSISRYTLNGRVRHALVSETARELGLKPDPARVAEQLRDLGGEQKAARAALTSPNRVRQLIEDIELMREIGRHYVDKLSVKVAGTYISQEQPGKTAQQRATELGKQMAANPERAAELAAQGDQPLPADLELTEVLKGQDAMLVQTPLFAVQPGTVLVLQPNPQQGSLWLVALVQERSQTESATGQPARVPDEVLEQVGLQMLRPTAERLGVTVSPRYGVWDEAALSVLGAQDQSPGQLLTANGADQ